MAGKTLISVAESLFLIFPPFMWSNWGGVAFPVAVNHREMECVGGNRDKGNKISCLLVCFCHEFVTYFWLGGGEIDAPFFLW